MTTHRPEEDALTRHNQTRSRPRLPLRTTHLRRVRLQMLLRRRMTNGRAIGLTGVRLSTCSLTTTRHPIFRDGSRQPQVSVCVRREVPPDNTSSEVATTSLQRSRWRREARHVSAASWTEVLAPTGTASSIIAKNPPWL